MVGAAGGDLRVRRDELRQRLPPHAQLFRQPAHPAYGQAADRRPAHGDLRTRLHHVLSRQTHPAGPQLRSGRYDPQSPARLERAGGFRDSEAFGNPLFARLRRGERDVRAAVSDRRRTGQSVRPVGGGFHPRRPVRGGRDGVVHRGRLQDPAGGGGVRGRDQRQPFLHHPDAHRRGDRLCGLGRGLGLWRSAPSPGGARQRA